MKKATMWEAVDGTPFKEVHLCQQHEIVLLLKMEGLATGQKELIASQLVEAKEQVLNILTMKESSHPAGRKANGATRKPRTPRATTAPVEVQVAPGMKAKMGA